MATTLTTTSTSTSSASANLTSRFWDTDEEDDSPPPTPNDSNKEQRQDGKHDSGKAVNGTIVKGVEDKSVSEELSTSGLFLELEPSRELNLELFLPSSVFVPSLSAEEEGEFEEEEEEEEQEEKADRSASRTSTTRGKEAKVEAEPQVEKKVEEGVNASTEPEQPPQTESTPKPSLSPSDETTTADMPREDDTMKEVQLQIPIHPIPSMQAAFAESMLEANDTSLPPIPKTPVGTAAVRRKILLDQDVGEDTHAAKWKQRPGQKYHELWKLMAQISFGVYLLMKGIAKDDDQVMNILQGHVDEVDEFLEATLEDFDLAQVDIEERLKFLKLPLENINIFDAMLEDRAFRLQIVSGNERIEHVITRTATAMNDALKDVQQGLDACKEFTIYLAEEEKNALWMKARPDMQKVFDAMKGNVEGWYKAYVSLQTKGHHLGVALVQLGSIVAEMDRRAADISRKSRFSTPPVQMASPPASPPSNEMRQSMQKNLPSDPNIITPAIRAALPAFGMVPDRERTPENALEIPEEEPEPEIDFILKPRTYTPAPSPKPPSAPAQEPTPPPPEVTKRSSLRKRFSLKRNADQKADTVDDYWGPRQRVVSSAVKAKEISIQERNILNVRREQIQQRNRASTLGQRRDQIRGSTIPDSSRIRESKVNERPRETAITTPPSRGLDSAYCSDFEKNSPQAAPLPPNIPLHQTHSHTSNTSQPTSHPRTFSPAPIPSPLSDRQFFRPVQASPNSPLQRPWTATPTQHPLHMHSNSSTSNLSSRNYHHAHTPSQLGMHRGAPSAMGMSVMSDMTMMTDIETGKKVKKKRSAFGWLKKAFSLDEEEKARFEERKVEAVGERERYYQDRGEGRRWVDGKRVR